MSDVLRRKLAARRSPQAKNGISVEAVLRKTMPRDADSLLSLDLSVSEVTIGVCARDAVLAVIEPFHLAFLMETSGGVRGAMFLDPGLLAGIVEVQVSGRVTERAPIERHATRTDAIVVSEVLDAWLATAEATMEEVGLAMNWPAAGFERIAGHLTRREVELLLEPVEFRTVTIALSLGGGAKTGTLTLATPRLDAVHDGHAHSTATQVRAHLPDLPVTLNAILARIPLDMSRAQALAPDTVLPLPDGCLRKLRIETPAGRLIREGQLGQSEGKRAVRLGGGAAGTPQTLGMLAAPSAPMPGEAAPPELPDAVGLPDLPEPGPVATPDLAPLGDLPPLDDLPDLPDLPELPELPDLP